MMKFCTTCLMHHVRDYVCRVHEETRQRHYMTQASFVIGTIYDSPVMDLRLKAVQS
jgi:hypothetical protein